MGYLILLYIIVSLILLMKAAIDDQDVTVLTDPKERLAAFLWLWTLAQMAWAFVQKLRGVEQEEEPDAA